MVCVERLWYTLHIVFKFNSNTSDKWNRLSKLNDKRNPIYIYEQNFRFNQLLMVPCVVNRCVQCMLTIRIYCTEYQSLKLLINTFHFSHIEWTFGQSEIHHFFFFNGVFIYVSILNWSIQPSKAYLLFDFCFSMQLKSFIHKIWTFVSNICQVLWQRRNFTRMGFKALTN